MLRLYGPEEQVLAAVNQLVKYGAPQEELNSLAFHFQWKDRPDIGVKILQKEFHTLGTMPRLEKCVYTYKLLRRWQGEEEALSYLHKAVPTQLVEPLTIVLYKNGLFKPILVELDDPDSHSTAHAEFLWLQKLIAWLALEKNPQKLEKEIVDHYRKSWTKNILGKLKRGPFDYYNDIGRYLLGMISRDELLSMVRTAKQRCEFAYYIGLSERLKANFPEAANWYFLCLETMLQNNGEYHWAGSELFWWAHMGTRNRHRLPADDIRAYQTRHLSRT